MGPVTAAEVTTGGGTPHVVVVGGGISGLVAAWRLQNAGVAVTLVEASPRLGGKLATRPLAGRPVDTGADAFVVRTPDALDLVHELGLDDQVVHPAIRSAALLSDGALHRLPSGLVLGVPTDLETLASSGMVSAEGVARAGQDLDVPLAPPEGDVALGPLIRDRLGEEVTAKLVAPLLGGVHAGDIDQLSLEAGAPQLAVAARSGSIIRGARKQARRIDADLPVFASLRGGMGALVDALVDALGAGGARLRTGIRAVSLDRRDRGYALGLEPVPGQGTDRDADRYLAADGVVLASPAPAAAALVDDHLPEVARELRALPYASVSVVCLLWSAACVDLPLDGSGFLVDERDGLLVTACSFGSSKWPHWAEEGTVVLRASVGRHHDRHAGALSDGALVDAVIAELGPVLGLHEGPAATRVTRWPGALPQFRPGHLDRVDRWLAAVPAELPGVALAGAHLQGLGIPSCVRSGTGAARTVLAGLAAP